MKLQQEQVAVVTGGASGIGLALAAGFVGRGLNVVVADVRADALDRARSDLEAAAGRPGSVKSIRTDVRDPTAVDDLAARTLQHFGRVDVVCNNAGVVGPFAPIWEQDLAAWRWVLDVALIGVIHGIRSFVPILIRGGSGHVLNTASVGGLTPLPMLGPYNAAKHAVVGLSETLRAELQTVAPGVGVTVLCPGMVDTPLGETSVENRPADMKSAPEGYPPAAVRARSEGALAPAEVARVTLDAMEQDRLHVVIPESAADRARERVAALLAELGS
jgi:NAD(P)-dependent dehydrogenase (short-subunit alcohol dehydrogenase family)